MDAVGETLDKLDPQGFIFATDERPKARAWLAKVIRMEAMAGQLGAADAIMRWLKKVAAVAARSQGVRMQAAAATGRRGALSGPRLPGGLG